MERPSLPDASMHHRLTDRPDQRGTARRTYVSLAVPGGFSAKANTHVAFFGRSITGPEVNGRRLLQQATLRGLLGKLWPLAPFGFVR